MQNTTRAPRLKKPAGYRSILTVENAKTTKGELLGWLTGILYLAPHTLSGVMNVCLFATIACINACLGPGAGRGIFPNVRAARIAKTKLLAAAYEMFLEFLRHDVRKLINRAAKLGFKPCVRVNGTSDIPKIAMLLAREFPQVMFYDYTKIPKPYLRMRPNYHITFSYSGENIAETLDALQHGVNASVVFQVKKGKPLPESWNGYRVIDGDLHDLRFIDRELMLPGETALIVGLRAKGIAKKQTSPFIVLA
jgi:hypothetical protein